MVSYDADPTNATALSCDRHTPRSLADAVRLFETPHFDPERCFANARRLGRQ